ncbi:hypothetical protein RhiJN_25665 [Ceratobasidium sp. AG-Ba]|nr:hypothetical protein RhiJN_25662 [Ceratobasidium sp. AG-Ba]QRV97646.1 hypothetical protein RhiJN_25665 [Ceratobasidium sp. AG-Ba]
MCPRLTIPAPIPFPDAERRPTFKRRAFTNPTSAEFAVRMVFPQRTQMSSGLAQSKQQESNIINRLSSAQPEPRRSQRSRRPSLHKLESDAYEAESQRASRPATPSELKPKPKTKNSNGEKGNRPGRIVQPANTWATQHSESPEPAEEPGSPQDDYDMESQPREVSTITRAEAIRRVSAHLRYNALKMLDDELQEVLEDIEAVKEEAHRTSPMEIEDRTFEALWQPSDRDAMGRRPRGLAGATSYDIETSIPLSHPPGDDTATEDSDEIEELGPGDSVSQRVPQPAEHLSPEPLQRSSSHGDLAHDRISNPKRSTPITADEPDDSDAPSKRPRTTLSPLPRIARTSPSPGARDYSHTRLSTPTTLLSARRPSTRATAPRGRIIFSTAPKSSASQFSLSSPPPTSDVNAVLTWAMRMITKAGESHLAAGTSRQASQTDLADSPYARLTSVLEDLRAHLAASASKPRANQMQPLRRPKDTDFIEDDAELLEAEAALALGKRINGPHKPCLSDFPGFRRHIASNAIPDLVATLITRGAYEVYGTTSNWAKTSYGHQWTDEIPDEPFQPAPPGLLGIMVHRGSCFRGNMMDRIRPEVCHLWPFIRTPHTPDDLRYNQRLAKRLLPNQFHCRNTKTGEDPYEHPALQACINAALFWSVESIGVAFEERFRPLSLPTVAFVLTKMQHGIEEIATGRFIKIELNVDEQRKAYESHLLGLLKYDKKAPSRLLAFREDWFKKGMAFSGAHFTPEVAPYQAVTRNDQIREDTPVRDRIRQAVTKAKARAVY